MSKDCTVHSHPMITAKPTIFETINSKTCSARTFFSFLLIHFGIANLKASFTEVTIFLFFKPNFSKMFVDALASVSNSILPRRESGRGPEGDQPIRGGVMSQLFGLPLWSYGASEARLACSRVVIVGCCCSLFAKDSAKEHGPMAPVFFSITSAWRYRQRRFDVFFHLVVKFSEMSPRI